MVFIKVCVIMYCVYPVLAEFRQFYFYKMNLTDVLVDGHVTLAGKSSMSKCLVSCIETTGCEVFGIKRDIQNKICYLYNFLIDPASYNGSSLSNMVYYSPIMEVSTVVVTTASIPAETTEMSLEDRCTAAPGYTYESGSDFCYKFVAAVANWVTAKANCLSDGGILTHLDTPAKFTFVKDVFLVPPKPEFLYGVYVGMYYNALLGYWTFSDGTGPVPNSFFQGGSPNSLPGECGWFDIIVFGSGISGEDCIYEDPYICEII